MTPRGSAIHLDSISKTFDGAPALSDASFTAKWGELHCLLGENGAGKTTLMNVPAGLYRQDTGRVLIDGKLVQIIGPESARRVGIGMVHQHFKLVTPMSVTENVMLWNPPVRGGRSARETERRIKEVADKVGFDVDPEATVASLSVAQQQRVEILKVLIAGAKILILDEPTAVLTDDEGERLLTVMQNLAEAGHCIVIITHKLHEVLRFANRITVMRSGRVVASFSPDGVSRDQITELMVGTAIVNEARPQLAKGGTQLCCEGLTIKREDGGVAVEGLNVAIRAGEIFGLAGVGGNGQTELAEALMGIRKLFAGHVYLSDANISDATPFSRRERGLAVIPADRYLHGLANDLSIADNFSVVGLARGAYGRPFWIDRRAIHNDTVRAIEDMEIHGAEPSRKARLLSGGNAQKLVLARELRTEGKNFVLAHSPTRGLDVRAHAAVHEQLRTARDKGAAVLLISEDLDEILGLSDRVGVLNRGRLEGTFDSPADRQAVGALMVGHA